MERKKKKNIMTRHIVIFRGESGRLTKTLKEVNEELFLEAIDNPKKALEETFRRLKASEWKETYENGKLKTRKIRQYWDDKVIIEEYENGELKRKKEFEKLEYQNK